MTMRELLGVLGLWNCEFEFVRGLVYVGEISQRCLRELQVS